MDAAGNPLPIFGPARRFTEAKTATALFGQDASEQLKTALAVQVSHPLQVEPLTAFDLLTTCVNIRQGCLRGLCHLSCSSWLQSQLENQSRLWDDSINNGR